MFDLDFWHEIQQAVMRNKSRSLLTAFGVFWGMFMLTVMAGMGIGVRNGINNGVDQIESNSVFMWSNKTSEAYKGFQRGRYWTISTSDYETVKQQFAPRIKYSSGIVWGDSRGDKNVVRGERSGSFSVMGFTAEYDKIEPVRILQGRFINDMDVRDHRKVCVVGKRVVNDLFAPGEQPIGELVRVNGVYYTIVGVVEPLSDRIQLFGNWDELVSLPITTLQLAQNQVNTIHCLAIAAHASENIEMLETDVKQFLKQRNNISPTDEQAITSFNLSKMFKLFEGLTIGINVLIWIVGLGTLLAGVIGVSNIMLVTVRERTQEIGVRRALGASPLNIIKQIMCESLVLTVVAGLLGLVGGVGVLVAVSSLLTNAGEASQFLLNPQISFNIAMAALAIIVVAGLFAGWLPSKRALQIKAIDALRDE